MLFFSTSAASFNLFGLFSNETELFCECEIKKIKITSDSGIEDNEHKCSTSFDFTINEKNKTIESDYLFRNGFKNTIYEYKEKNGKYSFIEGKDMATQEGVKTFAISRTTGDLTFSHFRLARFDNNVRLMISEKTQYNCDLKKNKKNKF